MKLPKSCRNFIWTLCIIIMWVNGIGYETFHIDSVFCVQENKSAVQYFYNPETLQKNEMLLLAKSNQKSQVLAAEAFRGNRGQFQRRNQEALLFVTMTVLSYIYMYFLTAYFHQKREHVLNHMQIVRYLRRSDGKKEFIKIYQS